MFNKTLTLKQRSNTILIGIVTLIVLIFTVISVTINLNNSDLKSYSENLKLLQDVERVSSNLKLFVAQKYNYEDLMKEMVLRHFVWVNLKSFPKK